MSIFILAISCLTTSSLHWFMYLTFQVPMQYCSLQHWPLLPSPVPSPPGHCFHFGSISLLFLELFLPFSSSILGTYLPGKFIFPCHIFLPLHIVRGVLKARIQEWFVIPFSSEPCFVRCLHHDPSILGASTKHGSWFQWVRQSCGPYVQLVSFLWLWFGFHSVSPLMNKDKMLMEPCNLVGDKYSFSNRAS